MGCIADAEVAALVDGRVDSAALARASAHAAECDDCRELLAWIGRVRAASLAADARADTEAGVDREASLVDPMHHDPLARGSMLRRYRIERELGRGGMGVVYEGHDPELGRQVAIKVLRHRGGDGTLARMAREARAVAALSHPNIVQIFDVSLTNDPPFIVMEMLHGCTLRDWQLQRGRDWREILRIYLDAGRGLAAAHAVGLVHRDFKPSNAIIDDDGLVKVLDFGLARPDSDPASPTTGDALAVPTASTLTATGFAVGTPSYMAPEQHRAERVDARADVYAFAVGLYEALYGTLPFAGRSIEHVLILKERGLRAEPPDPTVPASIHLALRRALACDPDERWPSMSGLCTALEPSLRSRRAFWPVLAGTALASALVLATVFAPSRLRDANGSPNSERAPVDFVLASQAKHLIRRAHELGQSGASAEGLGYAAAAVPLAAGSGLPALSARAQLQLCGSLIDTRRLELAVECSREAIGDARQAGDDSAAALGTIRMIYALGELERPTEALAAGRAARALADRLGDDGSLLVKILENEASALPFGSERIAVQEQVLAMRRTHPELAEPRTLAMTLHNLATYLASSDPARARELLSEALSIREDLLGPDHHDTLTSALALAGIEGAEGDLDACARRASEVYDRLDPARAYERAAAANRVAMCLRRDRQLSRGLDWIDLSLAEAERFGERSSFYAQVLESKATLCGDLGRFDEAETLALRALTLREEQARGPDGWVVQSYHNLAYIARRRGDLGRSETYARRSIEGAEALGDQRELLLRARSELGTVLLARGRHAEVLEVMRDELDAPIDAVPPIDRRLVATARSLYARALFELEDQPRALALAREAFEVIDRDGEFVETHDELRAWLQDRAR